MASIVRSTPSQPIAASSHSRDDRRLSRKKQQRTEIWTRLLRQTREAQAGTHSTQTLQHRELIICGGSPEDQRAFITSLARRPPPAPPARNRDGKEKQRDAKRGEVKLSNRYAYGYGHMTLYSPPVQQGTGLGGLAAESEEVAQLETHTLPEPDVAYEATLRRLLAPKKTEQGNEDLTDGFAGGGGMRTEGEERRPAVAVLLSWKEPWHFLTLLRRWIQLLSQALLPPGSLPDDPIGLLKEHSIALTLLVQHVEAQEGLEREGYREESFDYISQCLRTAILPLAAALVYTTSNPPPQQPGSALSEVQKVVYTSLALDLGPLSPHSVKGTTSTKREDLAPKHNVVDRMAIVVPSGWDSAGKIRLLSETFSPEQVLEAWTIDLNSPSHPQPVPRTEEPSNPEEMVVREDGEEAQANGGADKHAEAEEEVYATSDTGAEEPELTVRPMSPSTQSLSAIAIYKSAVLDPQAHKAPKPPQVDVTTKPYQEFLAEMRGHLLELEAQDRERVKTSNEVVSTTAGNQGSGGRMIGLPSGKQTGALNELGDVSFNVGGVSYNTVSAEAAIERLRHPQPSSGIESPITSQSPRTFTPRPPKREDRETGTGNRESNIQTPTANAEGGGVSSRTPSTAKTGSGKGGKKDDINVEELEAYFTSLMKKTGGAGGSSSGTSTPSKGH